MKLKNLFQNLKQEKQICFLTGKWSSVIAWNPVAKCERKQDLKQFAQEHGAKGRKIIGYIPYNAKDVYFLAFDKFENISAPRAIENKLPLSLQFAPQAEKSKKRVQPNPNRNVLSGGQSHNRARFTPEISKQEYLSAIKKIKRYIKEGDIYQINYAYRMTAETEIPPRELFLKIIEKNPADFAAYIESDDVQILSASPERFIKVTNRKIETCPIKGTAPRGKTQKEDAQKKNDLLENPKEKAELNMITDLLRNDLGEVCGIGSVRVEGCRLLKKCPSVWHAYSRITGELRENIHPIDALFKMLPGGSITGCPKKRAMEIIRELEKSPRGIYTGTAGYIDPNGDMEFNIAIRTIIKEGNKLHFNVGGGIVYDSDPESEYQETLDKARAFMDI